MNTKLFSARALRVSALVITLAGLGLWGASGAHVGWTQTSVVTLHRDEITGIDFPVRRRAFIAGVEVPVLATAAALLVAGLSVFAQRRSIPVKA